MNLILFFDIFVSAFLIILTISIVGRTNGTDGLLNLKALTSKVEDFEVEALSLEDYDNHEFPAQPGDTTNITDLVKGIHFYLYTKRNPTNPDELFVDDMDALRSSHFMPGVDVKILTHGFNGNLATAPFPADVNASYLNPKTRNLNVILVDWSLLAEAPDYKSAVFYVPTVAEHEAKLIKFLVDQRVTTLDKVHLIGHSLGAHVAGDVGFYVQQMTGKQVARATGLDPAKPLFEFANDRSRIDPTDAAFVDIIHTTGLTVGLLRTLGHADFYPNGGITQPGCFVDLACDHSRAHQYFAESVLDPRGFLACGCPTKSLGKLSCDCNGSDYEAYMGDYDSTSSRGIFYLETNDSPLYGRG